MLEMRIQVKLMSQSGRKSITFRRRLKFNFGFPVSWIIEVNYKGAFGRIKSLKDWTMLSQSGMTEQYSFSFHKN